MVWLALCTDQWMYRAPRSPFKRGNDLCRMQVAGVEDYQNSCILYLPVRAVHHAEVGAVNLPT